MLKYTLFILIILLLACNTEHSKQPYPVPDKKDINEIIKVITERDSLYFGDSPICIDLRKIKIYVHHSKPGLDIPPPANFYTLDIVRLINARAYYRQTYFGKQDSSYLLFQNNIIQNFTLGKELIRQRKVTTAITQERNSKGHTNRRFVDFSIPVFSVDQTKAYVQINNFCPFCGSGSAVFLIKQAGHWKIAKQYRTWIN